MPVSARSTSFAEQLHANRQNEPRMSMLGAFEADFSDASDLNLKFYKSEEYGFGGKIFGDSTGDKSNRIVLYLLVINICFSWLIGHMHGIYEVVKPNSQTVYIYIYIYMSHDKQKNLEK